MANIHTGVDIEKEKKNDGFIQIRGPLKAGVDIIEYIKDKDTGFEDFDINGIGYIKKLGITCDPQTFHSFEINDTRLGENKGGKIYRIGQTGVLQFSNARIISVIPLQYETGTTIIDCFLGNGE